jgi:hypothetical protein
MSTQNTNVVNTSTNVNSFGNLSDIFMNNMLMNSMNDIMKNTDKITVNNILKLIFLTQIGNIKQLTPVCYEYIKNMFFYIFSYIKKKYEMYKYIKNKDEIEKKYIYVPTNINKTFVKHMYNYLQSSQNCTFNIEDITYNLKNCKDFIVEKKLSNILIKYENTDIRIKNDIYLYINTNTNEIENFVLNKNINNKIKSLFDCMTSNQTDVIKHILNTQFNGKSYEQVIKLFETNGNGFKNYLNEYDIVNLIISKYTYFDKNETYVIILIISSIYSTYISKVSYVNFMYNNVCTQILNNNLFIFDISFDYAQIYPDIINKFKNDSPYSIGKYTKILDLTEPQWQIFRLFSCSIYDKVVNCNTNDMILYEINDNKHKEILKNFLNYINTFLPVYGIGTKISIFKLSITKNIKKEEIDNPAYKTWENDKSTNRCNNSPDKKIISEKIEKVISVKTIKKIYNDMNLLFIDDSNKKLLINSLNQFKNDKDLFADMGMDDKLNILLYGVPGTGKTTTIQTIASYLGKDIYYINLKEFETNADIQMIYDYVSKNAGNGIMVYEDIDCMSDVVLKRTEEVKETSINDICNIENDKFNLSYFLNLLQGCLTPSDSINILTTNFKDKLDSAVFRSGRMDLTLELKPCSHFQIRNIFKKMMEREINEDVLEKIPEYTHTPASIIYHLKNYRKYDMHDEEIMANFIE